MCCEVSCFHKVKIRFLAKTKTLCSSLLLVKKKKNIMSYVCVLCSVSATYIHHRPVNNGFPNVNSPLNSSLNIHPSNKYTLRL